MTVRNFEVVYKTVMLWEFMPVKIMRRNIN